jgi:hypothetical protein
MEKKVRNYLKPANLPGFVDKQPDVIIKRVKPGRYYFDKNQLIKEIGCGL